MSKRVVSALVALALALSAVVAVASVPECAMEDGSTLSGFEPVCVWHGGSNGQGLRYVLVDGVELFRW